MATNHITSHIRRQHAENVFHAVRFAAELGRPLNLHISINFAELGLDEKEATPLFQALNSRLVRWWRYERSKGADLGKFSGVHAHANPHQRRHVHWLIHVPDTFRFRFEAQVEKFLHKLLDIKELGVGLEIRPVRNAGTLAKYVLRGTEPAYAEYFSMWTSDEGRVSGRRSGTSRSIGRAARAQAEWKRRRGKASPVLGLPA